MKKLLIIGTLFLEINMHAACANIQSAQDAFLLSFTKLEVSELHARAKLENKTEVIDFIGVTLLGADWQVKMDEYKASSNKMELDREGTDEYFGGIRAYRLPAIVTLLKTAHDAGRKDIADWIAQNYQPGGLFKFKK